MLRIEPVQRKHFNRHWTLFCWFFKESKQKDEMVDDWMLVSGDVKSSHVINPTGWISMRLKWSRVTECDWFTHSGLPPLSIAGEKKRTEKRKSSLDHQIWILFPLMCKSYCGLKNIFSDSMKPQNLKLLFLGRLMQIAESSLYELPQIL